MKLLALLASLTLCATTAAAQPANQLSPQIETKVREQLVGLLKDPMSAQILVTKGPWQDEVTVFGHPQRGQFICAQVNAKNSYGAYIGFRPYMFIVKDDGQVGVWQRGTVPETDAILKEKCSAAPAA